MSTHLNDSSVFCLGADHEPGDIVKEDDRGVPERVSLFSNEMGLGIVLLVAHPNKLRSFSCLIRVYD